MRGFTWIGVVALALTACSQTVVFDQTSLDGGGQAGDGGGLSTCSGPPTEFFPEFPEVIIALDRSSGMNTRLGDTTALFAARDALVRETARYQKSIWFGYVDFPGATTCGSGCCTGILRAPNPDFQRFESALRALRPGGTLSSLGVYAGKLETPYDAFAAGLGDHHIVTTLCPGGKERMRRLMALVESGRIDLTPLLTHRYPLDRIVEAYRLFGERRDGVLKVAVTP